jgi:lipopolysaccharide biosynthesis glycosyltransferase
LLDHNPDLNFSVVVLVTRTSSEMNEKLHSSFSHYKNIKIRIEQFNAPGLADLPLEKGNYPIEIYARFWVADYFPADVDRVIYLDGDMVIIGKINPLLDIDFGGKMLAAVQIPGSVGPQRLSYDEKYGYFNSGVLVINLQRWRNENVCDLLVRTAHELNVKLHDPDQDVLNYCFHDQYIALDYIWNAISPFFKEMNTLAIPPEQIRRVVNNAVIVHFNGTAKPWNYLSFHPHTKEYLRCRAKTEWRDFTPAGFSTKNFFKKRVIMAIGERRAGQAMGWWRHLFAGQTR